MILIMPLVLIGGVNYLTDPDYTLRKNYIPELAEALANGQPISGPVNTNSRLLKKQWIEKLPVMPEVLVLGSSRTWGLSQKSFPTKTFYNASVTNCTFQDMYAFVNLFEKKSGKFSEEVIICTDQWLFGNSFSEKRWLYNRRDFMEMLHKTGDIPTQQFPSKWELDKEWIKELFSIRYLLRSIKQMGKTEMFEIHDSIASDKMMLLADGSGFLPPKVISLSEDEVKAKGMAYFYSSPDERFRELSPLQCQLFENLILYLKSKKCKITLFIPPYHPETFNLYKQSSKTSGIFKVDHYLNDFAKRNDLKIIGCTDPSALNMTSIDFYDAVHLKPQALLDQFKD